MSPQQVIQPLPPGFQLDDYRIDHQLSQGGFSFVYLAHDKLGTPVAIKEYLPNALAQRRAGTSVPVVREEHLAAFRYGMKCFFEEGRALALLNHPNLVRVVNFFRANETVYLVMQYERGRTLQAHIQKHKGRMTESFILNVFSRLLNGLREVHSRKLLHLDIKPSNIYLRNDGTPVLLDFGAARQTLYYDASMLKPMYTPGYAAPEQFTSRDGLGPWTDIYAIGASMYTCLSGSAPQSSDLRVGQEKLVPAARRWIDQYSRELLETIDWCMQIKQADRPDSVFVMHRALAERRQFSYAQNWLDNVRRRLSALISR